jgi:hypothetical protein
MLASTYSARKHEVCALKLGRCEPRLRALKRLLRQLELHRALRLLLHHYRPLHNLTALRDVAHAQFDQIAAAHLAVDR